jgi:AcrR family transcriptional regulator
MDDKKSRIIAVAKEMIALYGFKKTTMEEIASKARMGKSSMYYYFKNKEDIFAEIVRIDSDHFRQKLQEAIQSASSPQDKIMKYVSTRMLHLKELSNYYKTLTNEYLDHYFFIEQVREDFYNLENKTLSTLINAGIEQGKFAPCDVDVAVHMIAIAIKGLEYPLFVQKEQDLERDSKQMMEIIFNGIEVRA